MIKFSVSACAILMASALLAGTTSAAEPEKTESCLHLQRIKSTEIIDKSRMVFTMNDGTMYLNTLPYSCPGMSRDTPYMHRTSLSEICAVDVITILHPIGSGYMPGASCGLGRFEPVTKADVAALKEQIKADRAR